MSSPKPEGFAADFAAAEAGRFAACLAFTLAREGLWSDDPRDNGGATMRGVTLASYRAWMGDPDLTPEQLRAITPDAVRAFYKVGYWVPLQCELLPAGADLVVFDMGANAGIRRSAMLLQEAVGVPVDGWIGPATLAGVHKMPVSALITMLATLQDHYYRGCAGFPTFGRGWLARLAQRKATALSAAAAARQPPTLLA